MATETEILVVDLRSERGLSTQERNRVADIMESLVAAPSDDELEQSAIAHFDARHKETWRMMMEQYPGAVYEKTKWYQCAGNWQDHHRAKAIAVIETFYAARLRSLER